MRQVHMREDALTEEEALAEDVLSVIEQRDDAERRRELERVGRIAAEVEVDLADGGILGLYAETRRRDAIAAAVVHLTVDPRDAVAIAQSRAEIDEYLRFRRWARQQIEAGERAAQIIRQEYGSGHDNQDRD
jgi:hypothetical protein